VSSLLTRNGRTNGKWNSVRSGFSLLELVIVLAILVSLTAISWPRLNRLIGKSSLREAAMEFAAELAEARQRAIRIGQPVDIWILPDSNAFAIGQRPESDRSDRSLNPSDQSIQPKGRQASADDGQSSTSSRKDRQATAQDRQLDRRESTDDDLASRVAVLSTEATFVLHLPDPSQFDLDRGGNVVSDWHRVTRFLPDGRATDSKAILFDVESSHAVTVAIRGLTGGIKIESVSIPSDGESLLESQRSEMTNRSTATPQVDRSRTARGVLR